MINFICNFMHLFDVLLDWIFDIPDLYKDCIFDAQTCKDLDKELIHSFDKTVYAPSVINVTCTPEKRFDGLPDWEWIAEDLNGNPVEFTKMMPPCIDPTYCYDDPPHVYNAVYEPPSPGTMKYKDKEVITYMCENPEFVFPEPPEEEGGRPKSKWEQFAYIECGWENQFVRPPPASHKKPEDWPWPHTLPECVDPRGCKNPPPRNDRIWGSFEDSKKKSLDVGTVYWYECRKGMFEMPDGSLQSYLELKCVNDETGLGGAPYWDPPYVSF